MRSNVPNETIRDLIASLERSNRKYAFEFLEGEILLVLDGDIVATLKVSEPPIADLKRFQNETSNLNRYTVLTWLSLLSVGLAAFIVWVGLR